MGYELEMSDCDRPVTATVADSASSAPERDPRGRFLPGNTASLSHGLFSEQGAQFAALRQEASAFLDAQIGDEADPSSIPARRRALLGYRARVHRRLIQIDEAIELRGIIDPKGRLRQTWLVTFQSLVTTATALDRLLGLDRKQRDVTMLSPAAWLEAEQARQEAAGATFAAPGDSAIAPSPDAPTGAQDGPE